MQIAVMGAGYVGLVTAACFARLGHVVHLLEISPTRLEPLRAGIIPFHEPELQPLVTAAVEARMLIPTADPAEALPGAALVLVCVGTPLSSDGDADLSQVIAACQMIRDHAPAGRVAMRSTLPLGTTPSLADWLGRDDLGDLVTNPEFLRQGSAVHDFMNPSRIVFGTPDGSPTTASQALDGLYAGIDGPRLVTDFQSAEMIKNAANAFLATKLSFINEVADLCEAYGADIESVVAGMGMDPRIGQSFLRPGIGFGGSCLPKELANMVRLGSRRGIATPLMEGAARTNEVRAERIADRLEHLLGSIRARRVGLLGLSFKPNTDDIRYSPSVALANALAARDATVIAHDPAVVPDLQQDGGAIGRVERAGQAFERADLVILGTEWPEYGDLPWEDLVATVRRPVVYDGRNALDHPRLRRAGWQVISVGRQAE